MNPKIIVSMSALFVALSTVLPAQNSIFITYAEAPDDVNSRLENTKVFDFNRLTENAMLTDVEWEGVGTFDRMYVISPDAYGGAAGPGYENGSPYLVQGDFVGVNVTTLTLDAPHAYFGLWWSAGDPKNVLEFYLGSELVGRFTTVSLLDRLATSTDYLGNPLNRRRNSGENYAFINFFGQSGTTWDKIVLSNLANSGFESDNFTDRAAPWSLATDGPIPGVPLAYVNGQIVTPVPEPSTAMLALLASGLLWIRHRGKES